MATEKTLPDCGLYRTGTALLGHEDNVPKGALVMFHNHSDQGPPIVLPPDTNTDNRWTFHQRGWAIQDPGFIKALVPLKPQGLYTVKGQLYVERDKHLPERTLVQLGYNRAGDSIIFVGDFVGNSIHFPNRGYRFTNPDVQQHLVPVNFRTPQKRATLH